MMNKSHLHKTRSNPFKQSEWIEVLKDVFATKQLLAQPLKIMLPSNDKADAIINFSPSLLSINISRRDKV